MTDTSYDFAFELIFALEEAEDGDAADGALLRQLAARRVNSLWDDPGAFVGAGVALAEISTALIDWYAQEALGDLPLVEARSRLLRTIAIASAVSTDSFDVAVNLAATTTERYMSAGRTGAVEVLQDVASPALAIDICWAFAHLVDGVWALARAQLDTGLRPMLRRLRLQAEGGGR